MRAWIDRIVIAIGFIFLLSIIVAPAFARDKDDAIVVTADPIVFIQIGTLGDCSGFAANVLGGQAIVTAGHCAVDAIKAHAEVTGKDSLGRTFPMTLAYLDAVHDIAVYAYADETHGQIASAALACSAKLHIGDDATITGYPWDFGKATTFGKIASLHSAFYTQLWPDAILIDIFTAPGSSGSAAFNSSGEVIGILVGGDPKWQGLSVVVPITELCHPEIA